MTKLDLSKAVHWPVQPIRVMQVGWLGGTGHVYAVDDPPYDEREPGNFAPLYIERGD